MATAMDELRKALQGKKAIIGADKSIKNLKLGKLKKIFIAVNCPAKLKEDIRYYSKEAGCEIKQLRVPNDELGTICKKQFSIAVIGLLK